MKLTFSRRLAMIAGVGLPLVETLRRWHQLREWAGFLFWFDDVLIGAFLLFAAYRTRRDAAGGRVYLAAAWGFACAMGYNSFAWQLVNLDQADPSGMASKTVVAIKAVLLAGAVAALFCTLGWKQGETKAI